ncbi:hypothetical protein N7493_003861 [Penicillium malachiteum]|uniref:Ubiquitin-conjugating enzyme E2 Z n=1 Tax=Penicillium malachiteum TaxID=1324776 RepID=A0AAD6MXZ0_9EURO|nr:hypothetical protein N7493_003861 [Penicillium malachiteum]
MADFGTQRILRELLDFGNHDGLAMQIHHEDSNIRKIKAILVGTPNTPLCLWPLPEYPEAPPKVTLRTTNNGRVRFGPNLYASGKVCLSILGTWQARPGDPDGWSAIQGIESTLISIQSLFNEDPFYLEPGFEDIRSSDPTWEQSSARKYAMKIAHENIRLTVIAPLHNALHGNADDLGPFAEFYKQRFLWYRENYIATINKYRDNPECQGPFAVTRFEMTGNAMSGRWDWNGLKDKLEALENDLITEINGWPTAGLNPVGHDLYIAHTMKEKFLDLKERMADRTLGTCNLALVDENPFVWQLTYLGQSDSMLSDGVFNVKIYLSNHFPRVQPRVFVTTPIFHARVSGGGHQAMAYLPVQSDDMADHLQGIINVLEEANPPPYNPLMVVNTEAARLCWESSDNQREYRRRVRRSAQESSELL